jgi:hypothetical protein
MAENMIKHDAPRKAGRSAECGLQMLAGERKILFENGVAIDRSDYEAWRSSGELGQRVHGLEADPEFGNHDFQYALSTGVLRHKKNTADLEPARRTAHKWEKKIAALKSDMQEESRSRFSSASLMRAVMALVGIGSAVMSAYHTTTFLLEGGKPAWTAVITGTMLILFSGTAFTAARYFFRKGRSALIVCGLFIVSGCAVIVYSVFSTLTVNYNQFKWQDDAHIAVAVADSEVLAAHNRLLQANAVALQEAAAELEQLSGEAAFWRSQSWRRYDDVQAAIADTRQRRDALRDERSALEQATPELVETASASRETVYSFLARLLSIPEDAVRFFVYVIPACLYDILAPFALTVVLLLADDRQKQTGAL